MTANNDKSTKKNTPTAAMLIIGNEILSGRTQDLNLNFLATKLTNIGIKMSEVRIVPDIEDKIIDALNTLRPKFDYIFTTGGIGPTHDDITASAIAKAFGRKLVRNSDAAKSLEDYYGNKIDDARLKMADMPEDVSLIKNNVSGAPGFKIENVFVMAGVPNIMQDMVLNLIDGLEHGVPIYSKTIKCDLPESRLANHMEKTENLFEGLDIGSYPYIKNGRYGVNVVFRSINMDDIEKAAKQISISINNLGGKIY